MTSNNLVFSCLSLTLHTTQFPHTKPLKSSLSHFKCLTEPPVEKDPRDPRVRIAQNKRGIPIPCGTDTPMLCLKQWQLAHKFYFLSVAQPDCSPFSSNVEAHAQAVGTQASEFKFVNQKEKQKKNIRKWLSARWSSSFNFILFVHAHVFYILFLIPLRGCYNWSGLVCFSFVSFC